MKTDLAEPAVKKRIGARLLFAAAMLAPVLVVAWRMAASYSYERRHPGLPLDADGMVLPAMYLLACGALASAASIVLYVRSLVEDGRVTVWRCLELLMLPLPALPFLLLLALWFSTGTPPPMSSHP
jgi:hypothetical protein